MRRQEIASSWFCSICATCESGHRHAVSREHGEVADRAEIVALARDRASHHDHLLGPVAHGRDGIAGDDRLQARGHRLRVEAEGAGAVLVEHELDRGHLPVPVELRLEHVGVGAHDVANLVGKRANL